MSVNGKCQFSPKFIPLVKTWAQTKTDPEFKQLLDQFFENAEDVYNQFKVVTETPIGTIIGETTPETEPEIIPVEVVERSKSETRVVTTTDTISGLYVGRTEARKRMLRKFRREMLERSRLKISSEGKVTKVEPNVSVLENGVTAINKNLYEYKIDLINLLLKKIDPKSEQIPYNYDLSNEEFTAMVNKVLQANVELTDVEWDAYVILSKFDDLIEQEVPFIKIRPAFSKADYRVEGINKYEYVGSKVEHDSSWSTNEFSDSMHQASILAAVVLDYIPECDGSGRPIEDSSITLSGFYSCMTAMRDALMYHPTGALIEARKELRKGDNADMGVMISDYLQYLEGYKERSTSQYYNQHISYLIGKLKSIRKYIFNSELDNELKSVFRQMFVKNVRMRYMGYSYDYSTERIEGTDLQSSAINTQTYALLDTMASAIYRFRTQSSSAFSEALNNCSIIYKPGFNTFTFLRGEHTITFTKSKVSWDGNSEELTDILENVFEELTGYSLPENFKETFSQVNPGTNYNSVLGRAIFIIVNATKDGKLYSNKYIKNNNYPSELKRVELKTIAPLGKALSIIYGSNTANVVKNISGKKNFPLFGLNSLAYNYHYIMWQHMDNPSSKNIYVGSYLFESEKSGKFKPSLVLAPSIRSEIEINGKLKSVDQLSVAEVMHLALFSDFYRNVVDENSEAVTMQNTTFADKNTHFLINYRLDERVPNTEYTLRQMLQAFLNPKKADASEKGRAMVQLMYVTRRNRTIKLLENIIRDYNDVFDTTFQTLKQVSDWISEKGYTAKDIQKKFADKDIIAYEELHYCPKGPVINQQLIETENAYSSLANFEKILEKQKRLFVKDLLENGFFVNAFLGREGKDLADKYPEWFDESGNMILAKDDLGTKYHQFNAEEIFKAERITLNPVLESFFMADNLLSHEYNEIMIGGEYCHPGKDEASRLIAQIKRSVIFGATQHSFVQGLANGVAEQIKMAVMPDMPADTRNVVGDEDLSFKSMDGSAECTMLQARLESNSLLDARSKGLGYDKKNIGHDIDSEYGRPTLLKFAVYAMTNARRRASFKSKASQDRLLKRMYSAGEITIDVDTLNRYLTEHPVYFETTEDGIHYYEVVEFVQNSDGTISRQIMECDSRGNNFGTVRTEPGIRMNTLWSIDQAFGGAFTMSIVDGKLKYSETNNDVLEQFVTENPKAKDCQIAYLVNKSAIKVGAGNVNSLDAWFNDDELKTITMHTRYMGVQMDAEHDLDHAEVTEMTQLISALSQSGFTSDLVNEIYTTIGEVIDEALADYKGAIADYLSAKYQGNTEQAEKEKLKIYNLLGKVFIESFESGDRDTIGLAQAFVLKASKALKDGRSDYRLPFSADTVNGIFISTVSSLINKRGIKRKYDGFAGVLSPAYNQIQFYRVGGKTYMYRKFAELVSDMGITGYDKMNNDGSTTHVSAVDAAMNDYVINGRPNPFLKKIGQNEIDFEDTIVIREPDGNGGYKFTEVYVNSRAKYYDLKRTVRPNAVYYRFESKPRNLKGPNTKFEVNGKTYSVHDLDSVYAIEQMQQNPEKVEILPRTLDVEGRILYAEKQGWIYTLRRIDTSHHFGNPFSISKKEVVEGRAAYLAPNVKIAVEMYEAWLRGDEFYELDGKAIDLRSVEPERRAWIIEQFENGSLIGKKFAYHTEDIPDSSYVGEDGETIKKYDYYKAPNHAHILMKLAHEWMADKVLAKMEELPFISDEFRVEKPVETADLETWKTTAEFYSGAADGADQAWGKYLRELGLNVKDFTPDDYDMLPQSEKDRIEGVYKSIANYLNRPVLSATSNAGKYVRRDMLQAEAADAIFAIGTLLPNGYPDGGTAYAVTRAMGEKPIYFYDLNKHSWFIYDVNLGWVDYNDIPTLTPHAAVIGTRDDDAITGVKYGPNRLRPEGHEVIKAVIKQTFGEQTSSPVEEIQEGRLSTEGYYYNAQQVVAIDGVSDIITRTMANPNGGPSFVTIQGMAGTGKTSIINAILEKVAEDYEGFVIPTVEISAVSHKAKSVLFSKISKSVNSKFKVKAHSLAGLLGKGFNVETGEYEKGQSEKVPPIEEARIVFVDEASMLNEEDLNSIYEGTNGRNVTVVFIGDIGQINPIRNSPFFRNLNIAPDAPSPIFTTSDIPIFRLTERVRQGEDSPVLAYADKYYQFNTGQTAQYPNEVGQSSEDGRLLIQHGDVDLPTQLQDLFIEATQTLNPNKVKIVAGRQATVDSYNRRIQRITNPQVTDDSPIRFGVGDLVIFNDNYQSGQKAILNAQEGQVIEVDPTIYTDSYDSNGRLLIGFNTVDSIDIEYYNVTIKLDSGEIVTVKIPVITDSNISKLFTLRHNTMTAAKQDRSKWKIYYALKGEYAISLNDYKGTYKPLVSLGYAITAHKAQGSTYDVVAVDLDDIHSVAGGWTAVDKAKIIYTGLTRGSNISVVKDSRSRNTTSPNVKEINDRINLAKATKATETKAVEHEQVHEELVQVLGGDDVAREEVREAIKVVQTGRTFEEVLAEQPTFFTPAEQLQIKSALGDRKLKVMSASRRTDPIFLANDIIKFLEENAKKDFTDPTRVNVIEIWSKHDGIPMRDILNACKKYRVAPIVSFSITGLGGTSLEKGVMKHTDLLPLIGELITAGTLNPATTTIRIDPILPGVTDMNVIKDIVKTAKSFGIKKYVTSMVQSYDGYGRGVVEGINTALASEGKTYDWEKYYGIQTRGSKKGKLNFKPKQEWIDAIGSVLLEINADPEITLETCAFKVKGLKASACLDPLIIERLTGIDVMSQDGSYDRDTSRPECMCYGVHGDMFKYDHKCASSCAYCYAAHSEDSPFSYYNEDGTLIDSPLTRTRDKVVKRFRGRISADKFKLLQERVQSDLRNLRKGRSVVLNGQEVVATNVRVVAGECISGRYHAKQYMIEQGDNISDIDVDFFERKLRSRYNIDEYENDKYCSGVLFATNGDNYMVKVASAEEINEMLLKDPNVTLDKSIENIGGVYYKDDDVIVNAEGIKFCIVNVNGQLRNLILIEDSAFIGRLKNSSFFGFYRHVHDNDTKLDSEARWFNDEIQTIAKEMYDSFIKQRLVIGTRIPTQAMPSFMPMEIVDFTDSEVNDLYVPTDLLAIQGADLDIDKEYTLDLAIDKTGKVYTFSKLSFVDYIIDDLLDIKLPNGREFKLSNDPNALVITDIDLGTDADSKEVRSKKWVALINKCMDAPAISYVGSNPKLMDQFLRDLNTHCTSKLSRHHKEQALKNKIAVSIKKVTMSVENQAIAQISVDTSMKALSRVAENSSLAEKQKSMSSNNPATKFAMQIQNMVGKQVIGVTAVSLKQFFARTAYWNEEINDFEEAINVFKEVVSDENVPSDSAIQAAVIGFIDRLCKINPITGKRVPLSNLNFRDLLDKIRSDKTLNIKFGIPKWTSSVTQFGGLKIEYVPNGSIKRANGTIVAARCDSKNKRIFVDLQEMQKKYEAKAWRESTRSDALDIDFQSFEEWATFVLYHELGHYILKHYYDRSYNRNVFENEANAFAVDKILHLREVGDRPPFSFNGVFVKNFEELLVQMQKVADRTDASQLISALLSAATDNAKELILPKLNATTNFADIYTYLFSLGCTAEEVGKIMTSKQFSFIASIVNGNVFGVPSMKLQDAINLYLQQGVVSHIDLNLYNLAFGTHFVGVSPEKTFDERTKSLLQNEDAIDRAILNIKSLMGKKPTEGDSGWLFDSQIKIVARDFVSNPVSWGEGTAMIKVLLLHKEILRARKAYENENNDADLIKLMSEIIPGVEEQKILGTLTGLNQGLKTQAYEKRKWIQNIENYINRLFPLRFDWDLLKAKQKEGLIGKDEEFDEDRYAVDADYRSVWKDIVINPISFKFARFLNDKVYQEEWINKMDRVKVSDNILRIITTVPHFAKMMDAWRVDHTLIRMNVARNNIENQVADKLKSWRTQSISEAEWSQIKKYVNDVLIYNWITTQGFEFEYPKGGDYTYYDITGQLVPAIKPIQINSLTGIASFKQYMEQYLIPALKQKYGKHGIKRNAFIEALQLGATENYDGTISKYYKLPISMMNIDANASIEAQYNNFLMAFNEIADYKINGWKIGDLFYLYNLIVHKDGFGQSSLTRIFEDLVSGDDNLLVNRFNRWISQLDENAETAIDTLNMDLEDAKYRISKQVKSSQIRPTDSKLTTIDDNFTLMLPSMIGIKQEPMQQFEPKRTVVTSVKVGLMQDLIHGQNGTFALTKDDFSSDEAFIAALQEAGVKDVGNFVKMREFAKEQKAFIFDGIVFLNSSKADVTDLIHEWTHIILAKMKWGTERQRTEYYNTISSVVNHPKFNEIAERYKIDGKLFLHGSDLQEEVFVNLMQMYLQGRVFDNDNIVEQFRSMLHESGDSFIDAIEELVNEHIDSTDFVSVLLDALDYGINDPFKDDFVMQKHQNVANLKNKLVKENILKWECNG